MRLSVIVPVYNEESTLPAFLRAAEGWERLCHELLFVDGGSDDLTREILGERQVLSSEKGRGTQCALGIRHATGDALLLLHADSIVDADAIRAILGALGDGVRWGCLTQRYDRPGIMYALGLLVSNVRARIGGICFGDQAIFLRRELIDQIGGFPELPIMEDYELSLRLRRICWPRQLPQRVVTSARRFERGGKLRVALQMRSLRRKYRHGVPIGDIEDAYRDVREGTHAGQDE